MKKILLLIMLALVPNISMAEGKAKLAAGTVFAAGAFVLYGQSGDYLKRASTRNSWIQARKSVKFELGALACALTSAAFFTSHVIDVRLGVKKVEVTYRF